MINDFKSINSYIIIAFIFLPCDRVVSILEENLGIVMPIRN